MGNTNFQTIHQMGTAISNMVKQATGRDNVQNIDMEHVTVAQNHRYEEVDISGQVVSFHAGEAGIPFEKMVVQIKPVQDLHGYDHPWPGGGGKNKLNPLTVEDTNAYISARTGETSIPTPEGGTWRASDYIPVTAGDILFFGEIFANASLAGSAWYDSNKTFVSGVTATMLKENNGIVTVPDGVSYLRHSWRIDDRYNTNWETAVYIILNSDPHEFSPYSNICPITGWTMVNVYQAGQNMEDARVFRFPFPSEAGIVYGGTLDVISGVLTVDRAEVTFNGTQNTGFSPGTTANRISWNDYVTIGAVNTDFISDTFATSQRSSSIKSQPWLIYNGNGVPRMFMTIPTSIASVADFNAYAAQHPFRVVYYLASPIEYTLIASQVQTLLGVNNIWADTGDIEVKFNNVKELY